MAGALVTVMSLAGVRVVAVQQAVPSHDVASARPPVRAVATVNGVAINDDRLALAINALMPLETFHRQVSAEKVAEVRQKALDRLIDEELRFQDGVRRGITVSTAEVNRRLAELTEQYGGAKKLEDASRKGGVTGPQLKSEIRRSLTIQKAFAAAVTATCQVGREEAEAFFRGNPERFVQPEQLHVYVITIGVDPSSTSAQWAAARKRAENILGRIRAGASFEALARAESTDPSKAKGGDMGYYHRGTLSEDFEAAASQLAIGQSSDVIKTLYGFHILRIADVRPPRSKTFAEVSASLQKDLTSQRCTETEAAWAARLRAGATVIIAGQSPQ